MPSVEIALYLLQRCLKLSPHCSHSRLECERARARRDAAAMQREENAGVSSCARVQKSWASFTEAFVNNAIIRFYT